jgi:MSHA pilin protein MshD
MRHPSHRAGGVTLVELVMFIVLVGIAFSALLLAISNFTRHSADPLLRKQALAVAEAILEEVELMPFTYCDPDDPNASSAASTAGCTVVPGPGTEDTVVLGPEAGELRGDATTPFDNPSDYNGASITLVAGYPATVSVTKAGLGAIAINEALRISVTVTMPDSTTLTLDGYRTLYAPNTAP